MNKPHKHAEVIKAWADGAMVQLRTDAGMEWTDIKDPSFCEDYQYRIKPESTPDYSFYAYYDERNAGYLAATPNKDSTWQFQMKIIIDGETHEPKSVELVK
jgi:hypothetical protein